MDQTTRPPAIRVQRRPEKRPGPRQPVMLLLATALVALAALAGVTQSARLRAWLDGMPPGRTAAETVSSAALSATPSAGATPVSSGSAPAAPAAESMVARTQPIAAQPVAHETRAPDAAPADRSAPAESSVASSSEALSAAPNAAAVAVESVGGQPEDYREMGDLAENDADDSLSLGERRQLAAQARLRKLVKRPFFNQRRVANRVVRGEPGDVFIVAKYEMPLSTRIADLRFEIAEGLDPAVDNVAEYLTTTPAATVRDFQVVARFASLAQAQEGISVVRQRYDQAKAYQEQLLAYLRQQQGVQARSMRRC